MKKITTLLQNDKYQEILIFTLGVALIAIVTMLL
jgi:hypothetical protein